MMNMLMNWLKAISGSKGRFYVFMAVSLAAVCITFFLALKLSPWYYATNVHVRLHMQAPAETKINICWDKTQIQCLPLVPYLSTEKRIAEVGEIADVWLSELPPRPAYDVSLIFKSKGTKGIFQYLELDSMPIFLWGNLPGAGVQNIKLGVDQLTAENVTYTVKNGLHYIEGSLRGRLMATREIKPGPLAIDNVTSILTIWGLLFSIYLFFALPFYLLPFAVQNLGTAIRNDHLSRYPWWAYLLCGVIVLFMLLLTLNSPVMLVLSDQVVYLHVAIRQAWLDYPARPPGYYLFVALGLWLFNDSLEGIVLLQVLLFAVSTTICIWVLRRWLHPFVAVLVILGILFSPAQVNWALSIMRESLFASLVLLGVTAVIVHFATPDKAAARICLAIFAIVCGLALLIRENGILLPVVLLPVLLPEAIKRLMSPGAIWKRMQSVFLLFARYVGPVLCIGIVYFGLSLYNYLNYGYFQFTLHETSHHYFWRQITTSNFDSRSLLRSNSSMSAEANTYLGEELYRSFILEREKQPGLDVIYVSLFPTLNEIASKRGEPLNRFRSARIIDEIGKSADTLLTWKANLIGGLRQYREFVIVSNPSRYGLAPDGPAGLASKRELLGQMERKITYQGKPTQPDSIIEKYYHLTSDYRWYGPLFFLALLFSLYLLRYDDPVFLAPIALFIANALVMIILRMELSRFIEVMDILLVLQAGLGLSRWIYKRSSVI